MRKKASYTLPTLGIIFILSLGNARAFDANLLQTKVNLTFGYENWENHSTSLLNLPDCRYYQSDIDPVFKFGTIGYLSPAIEFSYQRFSLRYEYRSENIARTLWGSELMADFQLKSGKIIHPLHGKFSEHSLRAAFAVFSEQLKIFLEGYLIRENIFGGYEDFVEIYNPLAGPQIWYKAKGLGLGVTALQKIFTPKLLIFAEAAGFPISSIFQTYPVSIAYDFSTRKVGAWRADVSTGLIIKIDIFEVKIFVQSEMLESRDASIQDRVNRAGIRTSYQF
jgi:hypothetical protein